MASVNFQKCKHGTGDAGALIRHCDKEERMHHDHSNEHIDKDLTRTNEQINMSYSDVMHRLRERLDVLDATTNTNKRKDRVECFALESVVPIGMDGSEFSKLMYKEVCRQYGKENVMAWYLHRDEVHEYVDHGKVVESREHVHLFVVPEIDGQLKGKEFSSKANMQKLNKAIDSRCKELGYTFMTGDHPRQRSVEELKIESYIQADQMERQSSERANAAREREQRANERADNAEAMARQREKRLLEVNEAINSVTASHDRIVAENGEIQAKYRELDERLMDAEPDIDMYPSPLFDKSKAVISRDELKDLLTKANLNVPAIEAQQIAARIILNAEEKARRIESEANSKALKNLMNGITIEQIRKDFPEVDMCFDRNGKYKSPVKTDEIERSWNVIPEEELDELFRKQENMNHDIDDEWEY